MNPGDFFVFNDLLRQMSNKLVNLDTDTYKFALLTAAIDPTQADATPVFGDYTEVSGTNYTAGGIDVSASFSISLTDAVTSWLSGGVTASWVQHAAGPTDIWWGLLYNDQGATKYAAAYVNLGNGSNVSLANGAVKYTFLTNLATFTRS